MAIPLTKEEVILVFHAYSHENARALSPDAIEVQWLNDMLRRLPIHPEGKRTSDTAFRPLDGVARRMREFQRIAEGNGDVPTKYQEVWTEYRNNEAALAREVQNILGRYAPEIQGPDALQPFPIYEETQRRIEMWTTVLSELGTADLNQVPSHQIEAWSIDQTQAGIYRDKTRTGSLTPDGHGVSFPINWPSQK